MPKQEMWNIAILTSKKSFQDRSQCKSRLLAYMIFDFIHAICKATGKVEKHYRHWDVQFYVQREQTSVHNENITYSVPKKVGLALRDLRMELSGGFEDLFKVGRKEGTNLLVALNNGNLTNKELNDKLEGGIND